MLSLDRRHPAARRSRRGRGRKLPQALFDFHAIGPGLAFPWYPSGQVQDEGFWHRRVPSLSCKRWIAPRAQGSSRRTPMRMKRIDYFISLAHFGKACGTDKIHDGTRITQAIALYTPAFDKAGTLPCTANLFDCSCFRECHPLF